MGSAVSWMSIILIFGILVLFGLTLLTAVLAFRSRRMTGRFSIGLVIVTLFFGLLFVGGCLFAAAMFLGIRLDFGLGSKEPAREEQKNVLDYIPTKFGASTYCDVLPEDMFRYDDDKYSPCNEEWEYGNNFNVNVNGENIEINIHIGNEAYYDRDSQTLYIDFGVSEQSHIGSSKDFSVYLVSPEVNANGKIGKPLTSTLRPGESINKVECVVPDSLDRITFQIIVYNKLVDSRKVIYSGTLDGETVVGVIGNDNNYNYIAVGGSQIPEDAWIANIGSKNVPLYYKLPEDSSNGEDNEGNEDEDKDNDTAVDVDKNKIIGMWSNAERQDDYITTTWYNFLEDGTFEAGGAEFAHSANAPELFAGQEYGWHAVPMGFPYSYGTYKVENGYILLSYRGDSIEFEDYEEPIEEKLKIYSLGSEKAVFAITYATIDGDVERKLTCVKDFEYENVEELAIKLGVNVEP